MNKVCLQISLAVAVMLASSLLGFAVPQNGLATNGLATNGLATGAGAESPPPRQPQVIRMLRAR